MRGDERAPSQGANRKARGDQILKCLKSLLLSGNDVNRFSNILSPKRHSRGNPVSQSYHPSKGIEGLSKWMFIVFRGLATFPIDVREAWFFLF
jgi:hypothetical protein